MKDDNRLRGVRPPNSYLDLDLMALKNIVDAGNFQAIWNAAIPRMGIRFGTPIIMGTGGCIDGRSAYREMFEKPENVPPPPPEGLEDDIFYEI